MKKDFEEKWWTDGEEDEGEGLTFKELALGLLFCAAVLGISMGALYIRGRHFG